MSRGAEYYKQALERALGLLRQGAEKEAAQLIEDALALKLSFDPVREPELELAFDPREEELPRCWIEEGELCIDDDGWVIDPFFLEDMINSVQINLVAGLPEIQLVYEAKRILKQGIRKQKVRREK